MRISRRGAVLPSKALHPAPVPHGPGMQPPRPGMSPAHAPGLNANPARLDRAGHRLTPGHWSARGQIGPAPIGPANDPQTAPTCPRGLTPHGPQTRSKRAANRAACNGPGSVRKPPNRANRGKVSKRQLTCQTQKNPARGRDRLGLAGQFTLTNCQKSASGNCTMFPGLSD